MHSVERLEQALARAKTLGYRIQHDWLEGCGGACEIAGQKWIYLDLALSTDEQLELVLEALGSVDEPADGTPAPAVRPALRKSA